MLTGFLGGFDQIDQNINVIPLLPNSSFASVSLLIGIEKIQILLRLNLNGSSRTFRLLIYDSKFCSLNVNVSYFFKSNKLYMEGLNRC